MTILISLFFQFQGKKKIGFYKLFHSLHSHPDSPHFHPYSPHSHPDIPHSQPDSLHSHFIPPPPPHSLHFHPDSSHAHHSVHSIPQFPIPAFTECVAECVYLCPQREERTSSSWGHNKMYTSGTIENLQTDRAPTKINKIVGVLAWKNLNFGIQS